MSSSLYDGRLLHDVDKYDSIKVVFEFSEIS